MRRHRPVLDSLPSIEENKVESPLRKNSVVSPTSLSGSGSPSRKKSPKRGRRGSTISFRQLMLINAKSGKRHDVLSVGVIKNKLEDEIAEVAATLPSYDSQDKTQISHPFSKISEEKLYEYLQYIMKKQIRNENDLLVLRYYLLFFPTLQKAIGLKKNLIDPHEIIHKLSIFIQGEEFEENTLICLNGEIGQKFYLVLKGYVAVIIPTAYSEQVSEKEFVKHLKMLEDLKEYDLLNRTIDDNRDIYMNIEILSMASEEHDLLDINNNERISVEDYIKRVKFEPIPNEKNKRAVKLWGYMQITNLNAGTCFGDIALSSDCAKRTASIITLSKCFMGSLTKDVYSFCIKDIQDKNRKVNVEQVFQSKIFLDYNKDNFSEYYFNYFKAKKLKRGEYLFRQGDVPNEIYFLFEGEVEIQNTVSFPNINYILGKLLNKEIPEEKSIERLKMEYPPLRKFYKGNHIFKIFIIKNKDIIGLDDYVVNGEYFCSAVVISDFCNVYAIDKDHFKTMTENEYRIRINYKALLEEKTKMMTDRLKYLKNKTIQKFYLSRTKGIQIETEDGEEGSISPVHCKKAPTFTAGTQYSSPIHRAKMSATFRLPSMKLLPKESAEIRTPSLLQTCTEKFKSLTNRNGQKPNRLYMTQSDNSPLFQKYKENNPSKASKAKVKTQSNIDYLKNARSVFFDSVNTPIPKKLKKTYRTANILLDRLLNNASARSSQPIPSLTLSNINCLVIDSYIEKMENPKNVKENSSIMKGIVMKNKRRRVLAKKILINSE